MTEALREHWPEYLMEAAGLAVFMLSASLFGVAIEHPDSPVRQAIGDPVARRALTGVAMALTAIGIIYSPWGRRSGAHINPGTTLAFWRLGKIAAPDAMFYVVAQFAGGLAGAFVGSLLLGAALDDPNVRHVVTVPGPGGAGLAFGSETLISFALLFTVLVAANARRLNRYTGALVGCLIAGYITLEAPLSGMSMNPARTLASAATGHVWTSIWVYFLAPPLGMLLAAETWLRLRGPRSVLCAKLHHENDQRCIFRCNYDVAEPVTCRPGMEDPNGVRGSSLRAGACSR